MTKHLLIDAKNLLYRAVYAAAYDKAFQKSGHHTINIVIHLLSNYLNKFNPEQIHVFWDSPRSNTWRKQIDPEYKEGRGGSKVIDDNDVSKAISELTEIGLFLFKNIGIQQYYKDYMEADDLIYAFCRVNVNDDIVIISSDTDLKQITYRFPNVKIHSHLSKTKAKFEPVPALDPVIVKCFTGDKSDNIAGYHRVGPVKAQILTEDLQKRREFFDSNKALARVGENIEVVGEQKFKENLLLIDLSLCPHLLDNMMHVFKRQFKPIKFDLDAVKLVVEKYKLRGVTADLSRYVVPFKKLCPEDEHN